MGQEIDSNILDIVKDLEEDRVHGAGYLAAKAVKVLDFHSKSSDVEDLEDFLSDLKDLGRRLLQIRPSMFVVANTVAYTINEVLRYAEGVSSLSELKTQFSRICRSVLKDRERVVKYIVESAANLIKEGSVVLTHSYSSTVRQILYEVSTKNVEVIVTESRPLYEGVNLAKDLVSRGLKVTLITDAAVGHHIDDADLTLVGADTILADGSIINKMGTYLVALASERRRIPFYAASDTFKICPFEDWGSWLKLEEKECKEVYDPDLIPGLLVRNIYFDITPSDLVTAIISEEGLVYAGEVGRYARRLRKNIKILHF